MLRFCAALSRYIETALAPRPTAATRSMSPPATSASPGVTSRWTASTAIHTISAIRIAALTSAPKTSARWYPYVLRSFAGRAATVEAIRAITSADESVNICAASASRASEPVKSAPTTCTSMTVAVRQSEIVSRRRLLDCLIPDGA